MLSFSHALHEETRGTGVQVMALCPGYTHTEFHARAGLGDTALPEFMWQTPDQVVAVALRDLDRGRALSIPGAVNKVLVRVHERLARRRQPESRRPHRPPFRLTLPRHATGVNKRGIATPLTPVGGQRGTSL